MVMNKGVPQIGTPVEVHETARRFVASYRQPP